MKQLFLIIMLSASAFGFSTNEHPIYVSIAEVDYFTEKREIQVALKIFTDDLEKAIRKEGKKVNLDTPKEIKTADIYIKNYLKDKFKIKVNEKENLPINYVGKEYIDDATWMYFSYKTPKRVKTITIKNSVITELYPSQKNLTHLKKDRIIIDSKHFTKKCSTATFTLK